MIASLSEEERAFALRLYPNPSRSWASLSFTSPGNEDVAIPVYDVTGKKIEESALKTQADKAL